MAYSAEILPRIGDVDRQDWERCLPGEAENYDYYRACEETAHSAYRVMGATVRDGGRVVAVAPLFALTYRLDTSIQGRLRTLLAPLFRLLPSLLSFKVLGVGSPLAERCHLGFDPLFSNEEKQAALMALFAALDAHARATRTGLIAFKDILTADADALRPAFASGGFAKVGSLPLAVLELPCDEAAYIAALSANTRSSFRRKLKSAAKLRIEYRRSIDDLDETIMSLYEDTRTKSGLDYGDLEMLPPGYFGAVLRRLNPGAAADDRAGMLLFWLKDELIGFNLLLYEPDKVIDKFIGRRYPVSKDYHLFFVGWMENLRIALKRGARQLQSGQTHYAVKVRLGSRLEPSLLFFRHRNPLINALLRSISRFIAFDAMDPDLQALKALQSLRKVKT